MRLFFQKRYAGEGKEYNHIRNGGFIMHKLAVCLILAGSLLLAGDKKTSKSQDVQKCKEKCTKTYDTCMKNAKAKSAVEGCARSRDICVGACNK